MLWSICIYEVMRLYHIKKALLFEKSICIDVVVNFNQHGYKQEINRRLRNWMLCTSTKLSAGLYFY